MNLNTIWEDCIKRFVSLDLVATQVYIGHSGGKDSCLVHRLTEDAGYKFPVVHTSKNPGTPNGIHPKTLEFIYDLSTKYPILFCPLEQLASLPYEAQVDGTRADEAERSDGRSTDLLFNGETINRAGMGLLNPKGLGNKQFVYPLYDLSTETVWALIKHLNVKVSAEYE